MSYHVSNFIVFFGFARFTERGYFAMDKLDVRCDQD